MGGLDPNCKGATEKIDATVRPQREIADRSGMSAVAQMASVSIAIVPLLGDNWTQRGHHQIDVNDPNGPRADRATRKNRPHQYPRVGQPAPTATGAQRRL